MNPETFFQNQAERYESQIREEIAYVTRILVEKSNAIAELCNDPAKLALALEEIRSLTSRLNDLKNRIADLYVEYTKATAIVNALNGKF